MALPDFPVWPFAPNWSGTVTETLAWLTDILTSKTGYEQRRPLRLYPRQEFEYSMLLEGRERALEDNLLTNLGAHDWMLPLWFDRHASTVSLAAGATFIPCTTAVFGDFRTLGWALLVGEDAFSHEIIQLANWDETGFSLTSPCPIPITPSTAIVPLKVARFTDIPKPQRKSDQVATTSVRFAVQESNIRNFGLTILPDGAGIADGLVARQLSSTQDTSLFDPSAGTLDGQANMILAMFRARDALTGSPTPGAAEAATYYRARALDMLDAFAGSGSTQAAMMRQGQPANKNQLALPHWLFAAKDAIDGGADQGDGYEMIGGLQILAAGYSSTDSTALRDLDLVLTKAAELDTRDGARTRWLAYRDAIRVSHLRGRDIGDRRDVLVPLPNYPVVPLIGEPVGVFTDSDHTMASATTVDGSIGKNKGVNFFFRVTDGDVRADVPTNTTYVSTPDPVDPEEVIITPVNTLATVIYCRSMNDGWRVATAYQRADQYLFIQVSFSRVFDTNINERQYVDIYTNAAVYSAEITNQASSDVLNIGTLLIPRDSFITAGAALPPGTAITGYSVRVQALNPYAMKIRALRLLSGASQAAVAANVNAALAGEVMPFAPGVAPGRISGDVVNGRLIGFNGMPTVGAQRPDNWADIATESDTFYAGIATGRLGLVGVGSQTVTFPLQPVSSAGGVADTKSPSSLLAEQNIRFLDYAQKQYVAHGGKLGPFTYTFVVNTRDRALYGNPEPHTWIYGDIVLDFAELFWQARTVESLARFYAVTKWEGFVVVHNGQRLKFNGNQVTYKADNPDTVLSYDKALGWNDARSLAQDVTVNFLNWYRLAWPGLFMIVHGGKQLTYNGKAVSFNTRPGATRDLDVYDTIPDPRLGLPYRRAESPHVAAVVLRAALWLKSTKGATYKDFDAMMVDCWNYMESYWTSIGDLPYTWATGTVNKRLYALYLSEIIITVAKIIERKQFVPAGIDIATAEQRLILARLSFEALIFGDGDAERVPTLPVVYRGYSVLVDLPNEREDYSIDVTRTIENFEDQIAFDIQGNYDLKAYNRNARPWYTVGRQADYLFRKTLYAMRGKTVPIWVPTNMNDIIMTGVLPAGSFRMNVQNVGYTVSGGPRSGREYIHFRMYDGTHVFRRIVSSVETNRSQEVLTLDQPISQDLLPCAIHRISFIDLMRFDQDTFEISHETDIEGVSTALTYLKSVKTGRKSKSSNL